MADKRRGPVPGGGERRRAGEPADSTLGGGARVTLKVLADHLGLSPALVSLVLNRAPGAEAIPGRPRNASSPPPAVPLPSQLDRRSLRHRRSFTIGVMVPEISDGYASMVMSGIEDQLLQEGYLYFVASHRHRPDLIENIRSCCCRAPSMA